MTTDEMSWIWSKALIVGFPGGSVVKNPPKHELWVPSLDEENSLEKEMGTTPVFFIFILEESTQSTLSFISGNVYRQPVLELAQHQQGHTPRGISALSS